MSTFKDLTLTDYQAIAEFRHQIRRFVRFSENAAVEAGLEPQQHQLLLAIKGLPEGSEARIGDLAGRLQIHHHSAVELVGRLASKGLVQRVQGEDDRREVYVRLTPRGERILAVLTRHHRHELRRAAPALAATLYKLTGLSRSTGARSATRKAVAKRSPSRQVHVR